MCGRYYIDDEEDIIEMREIIQEVNERFKDTPELAAMKTGEIFPTNIVPILTAEGSSKRAELMRWGYPRWDGSGIIINARAETAIDKPMFKKGIESKRCLIPTTGFFEWKHENGKAKKDKYLLRFKDDPMLSLAGIYNTYKDKDGNPYNSFVILTTNANDSVKPIHNRMPVILTGDKKDIWLYEEQLSRMLLNVECDELLDLIMV